MPKISFFGVVALMCASISFADPVMDKTKYISIDEVKPGMDAYCLTVYQGTKIEKFPLEVINVARNIEPGRNAIIVKGIDPRFEHTGPVAGCSGSPVYINGRLAGALAFGWPFSKDALYGVTPIAEMHRAGEVDGLPSASSNFAAIDFTKPIDLAAAADAITKPRPMSTALPTGASVLPSVLATSNLPADVARQLNTALEPYGLMPVTGLSAGDSDPNLAKTTKLEPGASLVIPMVDGDIKMSSIGTVTDVDGDKIYAFGHSMLGQGSVELPIATGTVSTVVASMMRSFKFGSALETKGALIADESTAVVGKLGKTARTIPLSIRIERFNDANTRTYNCTLATHETMSPMMLMSTVSAAAFMRGPLPAEHSIAYKAKISLEGLDPIIVENTSTGDEAAGLLKDSVGAITLLMNNPYKRIRITGIDIDAKIMPKSTLSHIWSVTLSDTVAKPGQTLDTHTVIEPYLAAKQSYDHKFKLPADIKPGEYELMIMGADGYAAFLKKAAPQRFIVNSLPNLLSALRTVTALRRDRLYYVLLLPPSGVAIESETLADLPASKAIPLVDDKRTVSMKPSQDWIESSLKVDSIISDAKTIKITVEDQT